jgi:hypothetical protein
VHRVSFSAAWRRTEPGSALLIAALAAMLLATSASAMLIETRAARLSSGEMTRLAVAHAQAEALLAEALVRLDSGVALPTEAVILTRGDGRVLRQDAGGLLDVNAADPAHLAALMIAAGLSAEIATTLADRIADWRDEDHLRRIHGAEARDYAEAGHEGPANRPFIAETEIANVLGIDPDLATCLAPWLTTYSGSAPIDPGAAPQALRAALGLEAAPRQEAAPFGRVIALTAEAPISPHAVLRRTLWVRLTGDSHQPVLVHRAAETLAPRDGAAPQLQCAILELAP